MDKEMEDQLKKLSLTEEEQGGVKIAVGLLKNKWSEGQGLVGKLLANRPYNMPALLRTLRLWWKVDKGVELKEGEGGVFTAFFAEKRDRDRVLRDAPWLFDDFPVLLKPYDGRRSFMDVEFFELPVWIHIHNMPMGGLNREVGRLIGSKLGKCLEVEVDEEGFCLGSDLRVKVELDIRRPIPRGVMVEVEGESPRWLKASYERLPVFCSICGLMGHGLKFCERYEAEMEKAKQYGEWLRHSPKKKTKPATYSSPRTAEKAGTKQSGLFLMSRGNSSPLRAARNLNNTDELKEAREEVERENKEDRLFGGEVVISRIIGEGMGMSPKKEQTLLGTNKTSQKTGNQEATNEENTQISRNLMKSQVGRVSKDEDKSPKRGVLKDITNTEGKESPNSEAKLRGARKSYCRKNGGSPGAHKSITHMEEETLEPKKKRKKEPGDSDMSLEEEEGLNKRGRREPPHTVGDRRGTAEGQPRQEQ